MRKVRKTRLLLVALFALVLAGFAVPVTAAPLTGAIFTTTDDGQTVNGNVYDAKEDVYLNGGPQPNAPCTAAGLPDGNYYFQVTDPSGATLLSSDGIAERKVKVEGGVITQYLGATHVTGTGKCPGTISVALMPYDDTPNPGGEYKTWMTRVGDYDPDNTNSTFGFRNSLSKTDNFHIRSGEPVVDEVAIIGNKFYDANVNGDWDGDEPGVGGWKIFKQPPESGDETDTSTVVGQIGQYAFLVPPDPVTYLITEGTPLGGFYSGFNSASPWINTTDTSGSVGVSGQNAEEAGPDFGNVCLGAGNGKTLGFWSNKNGQALITTGNGSNLKASVQTLLNNLNLRKADGSDFVSNGSYSQFRNWLLSATATNMAYMLSAQLAATELNVNYGSVNGSAMVYAPDANGANAAGFISVNDLMAEANTELGAHGLTLDGSPDRAYQQDLKNALDESNNNLNFVQGVGPGETVPCAVPTSWNPLGS